MFSKPSWQTGAGVPDDASRDVPDISFSASPNHDGFLICSQSFFASVDSGRHQLHDRVPGQRRKQLGSGRRHVGRCARFCRHSGACSIRRPAPTAWATSTPRFTVWQRPRRTPFTTSRRGDNNVPCTQGSKGCPTAAPFQYGFSAGTGYDQVTGLGSVNVTNLANAWAALTPSPDFSLFGYSATVVSSRAAATSQIVVESSAGFNGTVGLTCQPASPARRSAARSVPPQ